MLNLYQRWIKRLHLNQIYGQLIALILVPTVALSTVGSWLVYSEAEKNYLLKQHYIAQSILVQYKQHISNITETEPHQLEDKVNQLLKTIMLEQEVQAVSFFYAQEIISIGHTLPFSLLEPYIKKSPQDNHLEPIQYHHNHVFVMPLELHHKPAWLAIEMDNQGLSLLKYRILMSLGVCIFLILVFLTISLTLYTRYWLSPVYKLRLQLQQLTGENLEQYRVVESYGELMQLQQDIDAFIQRLNQQFIELKQYADETENDTRQMLDRIEIESAKYQQQLASFKTIHQAKSMFLANISHELRTPLNSISGFIQLLLRQKNINPEYKVYLETMKKSSAHLLALINDVLDYSKIEAGKLQLEMTVFNLEQAIFDVMDMLSPLAKNVDLVFYYPADVPVYVCGDSLRFKQILTNLVSNAIKFTPEGEIIVRVRLEKHLNEHDIWLFSVQDSGIGMSGAEQNKVFESFSQADISITRQYGGTGLGLAISKQLVQLMNGEIGFRENQGLTPTDKGTTFWFTACLKREDKLEHCPKFPTLHVLSYFKTPALASVLRYYLEQTEIDYHETTSAFEMLNRLTQLKSPTESWLIIQNTDDLEASLTEIRQRYTGKLAVCGYQTALNLALLKKYQAYPLYQPIYRPVLWQLFQEQLSLIEPTQEFDGQHLQVLAVDDHLPNLLVLEALLNEFNIQCVKALSGQEALQLLQQRMDMQQPLFDLIFMDIQMPVMSGIETARAIRSLESTLTEHKQIPIIALSAHNLSDDKQQIFASGMNDYTSKPIRLEQMVHLLQRWGKMQTITLTPKENTIPSDINPKQDILNWQQSLTLVGNKHDLALDLLDGLINSFESDCREMTELIEIEDFPQLESILHRLLGATRYVGVPTLQGVVAEFEQFVSILRKEQRTADDEFAQQVQTRFEQLKNAMCDVKQARADLQP